MEYTMAVFGDVHLGHHRTKANHIISNLYRDFPDNQETAALDMITIEGDWTDRDMTLTDPLVWEIFRFVVYLARLCAKHDIVFRVLLGTRSHDWNQLLMFQNMIDNAEIKVDFRYISTVCVERIEKLGIDVLYVPDEWKPTTEETWQDVQEVMRQAGLEKVDHAIMHGAFEHQLPKQAQNPAHVHILENYQSIVRKFIFIGHVHFNTHYQNVLAAGSYDRVGHGEERAKGHYRVTCLENGDDVVDFIENKGAKKYITVDCTGLDEHEAREKIVRAIKKLPEDSHVRVKCRKGDVANTLMGWFYTMFPSLNWTLQDIGKQVQKVEQITASRRNLPRISITKTNIADLLVPRVIAKMPQLGNRCAALLQEIVDG